MQEVIIVSPTVQERRKAVTVDFSGDKGRTRQDLAGSTDIGSLVAKFTRQQLLEQQADAKLLFGDGRPQSLQDVLDRAIQARSFFDGLSAEIKAYADHNPGRLAEMLQDEHHARVLAEMGLRVGPGQEGSEGSVKPPAGSSPAPEPKALPSPPAGENPPE